MVSFGPGTYALDREGVLHPWRRRYRIDVVAKVKVTAKERRNGFASMRSRSMALPASAPAEPIDWPDAPLPEVIELAEADEPTADSDGGREARTPEGTSGAASAVVKEPVEPKASTQVDNVRERRNLTKSRANAGVEAGRDYAKEARRKPRRSPSVGLQLGGQLLQRLSLWT